MIVILDGNSIAYRAFYKAPPLTSPDGLPTGTIHVFFSILEKVRKQLKPSKILAVFDSKGDTSRHELFSEYKATRHAMHEDLSVQLPIIQELLSLASIPVYAQVGVEADDIIASLVNSYEGNIAIVTKDKDLYQLVDNRVGIFDDQNNKILGINDTIDKYGVPPEQILPLLSLIGDTSDNIPGVTGVGKVTAVKLVSQYGSLDGIYNNIESIKGKVKENLINDKEKAYLAQDLISLHKVCIPVPIENGNKDLLKERLSELGMKTVANTLLSPLSTDIISDISNTEMSSDKSKILEGNVDKPLFLISVDNCIYVANYNHYEVYNNHDLTSLLYFYDVKELSKSISINIDKPKDYLLISWLCDPDNGTLYKNKNDSISEFIDKFINNVDYYDSKLNNLELEDLYNNLEYKIALILARMELNGIVISAERIKKVESKLKKEVEVFSDYIKSKSINPTLNLNSPKQLAEFLYDELGIMPVGKKNRSTAEEVLKELAISNNEYSEIISNILSYRELAKILSTYTSTLLDCASDDSRIHSTFKQTGTSTGRLSSIAPNLQNIPARGELGKSIRSTFITKDGYSLASFDYSQIELRILAHLSEDPQLLLAFKEKKDIHTITSMNIFNIGEDEVTEDIRRLAKAVNFGVLYGLSPFGLSKDVGISPKEAKKFIDAYFELYSNVRNYISDTILFTRDHGYCQTILGRKRFFSDINSRNVLSRQRAERGAINAPIQGSAADIIKLSMIKCDEYITSNNIEASMCLQVHDELIFEVSNDILPKFMIDISEIMQNVIRLKADLVVHSKKGSSWGDL